MKRLAGVMQAWADCGAPTRIDAESGRAETRIPPEKELKAMVRDRLLAFNKGVQAKNFSSFYKQDLATLFRDQMSLEKFTEAFQSSF